jgi:hypothetical protein
MYIEKFIGVMGKGQTVTLIQKVLYRCRNEKKLLYKVSLLPVRADKFLSRPWNIFFLKFCEIKFYLCFVVGISNDKEKRQTLSFFV